MLSKLYTHIIVLPRWFALPAVVASVVLGSAIMGEVTAWTWIAALAMTLGMAGAHSTNSWLDYLIGWDRGEKESRSTSKMYTAGSQVLPERKATFLEVFTNSWFWYVLAAIPTYFWYDHIGSAWIWLLYVAPILLALIYSFSKKLYFPELVILVGFGIIPCFAGAFSQSDSVEFWKFLLCGVTVGSMFAFSEIWDQWQDCPENITNNLNSLGVLVYKAGTSLSQVLSFLVFVGYLLQVVIVQLGYLSTWSYLSLIGLLPFMICWILLESERYKWYGVGAGLLGIGLFGILMALGQYIAL